MHHVNSSFLWTLIVPEAFHFSRNCSLLTQIAGSNIKSSAKGKRLTKAHYAVISIKYHKGRERVDSE